MSFTSIVKNEISKIESIASEQISQLSALIRNLAVVKENITITTENASVARCIFKLIKDLYEINAKITVRKGYHFTKNYLYILEINRKNLEILNSLGLEYEDFHWQLPREYIVADEELLRSYLRGVFLACGSINDPKKSRYHLEFLVDDHPYAVYIQNLLNQYYLNSKVIKKDNKYMIYVKEAEKIGDFLRIVGAMNAVFYFEDIRIYRDHKNMTNRLNNCEQANEDKVVMAANEQLAQIARIEQHGCMDLLGEKERIVVLYRKKYPDVSIQELSEIISVETNNPITKSGLHHRFHKISLLAQRLKKGEKGT